MISARKPGRNHRAAIMAELGTPLALRRNRSKMSARTKVTTVLNTLEHERHARGALIAAFANELRAAIPERAPESTRTLAAIAKAEAGEIDEHDFEGLISALRSIAQQAA
jgi:hypothetical protein